MVEFTEKGKPIYDAIVNENDIDKVRELVINPRNVDINMVLDEYGNTALHEACSYGKLEIVQLLLNHGADIHQTNKQEETALHEAEKVEIVQLLLDHGADIHETDRRGQTALHMASEHRKPKIVKLLLQWGAHVSQQDNSLYTPLHKVFYYDFKDETNDVIEIVKELLLYGADITITNGKGKTPMDMAKKRFRKNRALKIMKDYWKKPESERKQLEMQKRKEGQQHQQQQQPQIEIACVAEIAKDEEEEEEDDKEQELRKEREKAKQRREEQLEREQKFYKLVLRPFENNNNTNDLIVVIKDEIIDSIYNLNHLKTFYTWIRRLQSLQEIRDDEARNFITIAMEKMVSKVTNELTFVVFELILLKAVKDKLITKETKILLNRRAENMETSNSKFVNDIRMDILQLQQHVNYLEKRTDRLDQTVDDIDDKIASLGKSVRKVQKALKKKARVEAATGFVACILNAASWGVFGSAVQGVMSQVMNHIVDFGDIVHIESIVDNIPNNETLKEAIQVGIEAAEQVSVQDIADLTLDQITDQCEGKAETAIEQAIDKVAKWGSTNGSKKKTVDGTPTCGEETSLSALVFVAKVMHLKTTKSSTSSGAASIAGTTIKKKLDDSNAAVPAKKMTPTQSDDDDYLLEPALDEQDRKNHELNLFIAIHGGDEDDINDELEELDSDIQKGRIDLNTLIDSRGRTVTDFAAIMGQVGTMNRLIKERNGKFKIRPRAFMKQLARKRSASSVAKDA